MAIINGRGIVGIRSNVTVGPVAPATPTIITSGLKLYLDAGNSSSYPGTGTVWTDISGNGNTGTLNGGVTYNSSNGGSLVFNGSNGYVDCGTGSTINTKIVTISCWIKTTQTNFSPYGTYLVSKIGTVRKWTYVLMMIPTGKLQFQTDDGTYNPNITTTSAYNDGKWYNVTVTNDGVIRIYVNGVLTVSGNDTAVGSTLNNNPIWVGSNGSNGGYTSAYYNGNISNLQIYNRALTVTEVTQNYDVFKSRFYPQVSDSDAQSFIYAAGIQDTTQASAVNTLVTSLKSYGIWTKMKAIYPMVGGTAASHKWNLKDPRDLDAAFRLTFTAGWVHSSTGAKPNGTSDYANTFLNGSSNLTNSSIHLSFYSRTNITGVTTYEMGAWDNNKILQIRSSVNAVIGDSTKVVQLYTTTTDSRGFWLSSKRSDNDREIYRNGLSENTNIISDSLTMPNYNIYIGARNDASIVYGYSVKETAFSSIGDGLTDTEASNFYTAVQTYQTTLGRQV